MKRRKKVTADAWVKVKKQVKDAADGKASGLDVGGVADGEDSAEIRIKASSPDVFAYVAAPAASFTKPPPPPPPPAPAVEFSPDVDGAVVRLLAHGPSGEPDLKRAFEEIGSEADRTAALQRLVGTEGTDPQLVQRARILLPGPGGEGAPLPPPS